MRLCMMLSRRLREAGTDTMLRPIGELESRVATAASPLRRPAALVVILAMTVILASFLEKLAIITLSGFNLSFDEAYYWHWSKQLDWCYFSKGPGIALLIRTTTSLLGDTELGVRAGALFCSTAFLTLMYVWNARFFQCSKTALLSIILFTLAPFMMGLGVLTTIDSPLVLCWGLATICFWKTTETRGSFWWVATGLAVAAGTQFKFTMLFFVASMLTYAAFSRWERTRVLKGTAFVCGVVAVSLIPIILWNSQHGWITFGHTATKASTIETRHWVTWIYLVPSLVQQIAVISPLIGIATLIALCLLIRDTFRLLPSLTTGRLDAPRARFLFAISAPVCLFYALLGFHRMVEANWMAVIYVTLIPAAAYYWIHPFGRIQRWTLAASLGLAVMIQLLIPLGGLIYNAEIPQRIIASGYKFKPSIDPTNRLQGWSLLGERSREHVSRLEAETGKPVVFLTDHYSMAAWVGFYTKMPDRVFVLPHEEPNNQFDLWGTKGRIPPKNATGVFVYEMSKGGRRAPYMFEHVVETPDEVSYYRAKTEVKHFLFFFGYDFKGDRWWIPPEIYVPAKL